MKKPSGWTIICLVQITITTLLLFATQINYANWMRATQDITVPLVDSVMTARCPQVVRSMQDFDILQAQVQYLAYCEYQRAGKTRQEHLDEYRAYWDKRSNHEGLFMDKQ